MEPSKAKEFLGKPKFVTLAYLCSERKFRPRFWAHFRRHRFTVFTQKIDYKTKQNTKPQTEKKKSHLLEDLCGWSHFSLWKLWPLIGKRKKGVNTRVWENTHCAFVRIENPRHQCPDVTCIFQTYLCYNFQVPVSF